jgi:ferritin-like protein
MLKWLPSLQASAKINWDLIMAASSATLHEDPEKLGAELIDRHRALVSLQEELEAVDWYAQRVAGAHDEELKAILAHNRDEEKEHAVMLLEWLRRRDAKLDAELRERLFTKGSITAQEEGDKAKPGQARSESSLDIGSLREEATADFGSKRDPR